MTIRFGTIYKLTSLGQGTFYRQKVEEKLPKPYITLKTHDLDSHRFTLTALTEQDAERFLNDNIDRTLAFQNTQPQGDFLGSWAVDIANAVKAYVAQYSDNSLGFGVIERTEKPEELTKPAARKRKWEIKQNKRRMGKSTLSMLHETVSYNLVGIKHPIIQRWQAIEAETEQRIAAEAAAKKKNPPMAKKIVYGFGSGLQTLGLWLHAFSDLAGRD